MSDTPSIDPTFRRAAIIGGGIVALVVGGITLTVGLVSGIEADHMLETALPTIRFLSSSVMTAAATTLALLLTLLSFGKGSDEALARSFYHQVRQTARLAVGAFVGATVLLTAIVIPFGDESGFSATAYSTLYYVFTVGAALVAGSLVAVVVSLYKTLDGLIETFWFEESPYAAEEAPDDGPARSAWEEA